MFCFTRSEGKWKFVIECINIHWIQVSIQAALFPTTSSLLYKSDRITAPSSSYNQAVPNAATKGLGPYEDDAKECHRNSVHSVMQQAFLLLVFVIIQAVQLYSAVLYNCDCMVILIRVMSYHFFWGGGGRQFHGNWSNHDRWKFPRNLILVP
jgi:hypothetical protein